MSFEENYCSNEDYRLRKFKSILDFVKSLSIPERNKLIIEIQLENYFNEYDKLEVVKNNS